MNEVQQRVWAQMLREIHDFRSGARLFPAMVQNLEALLDAGEFEDKDLVEKWYSRWTPLEIRNAVRGSEVDVSEAEQELLAMEELLRANLGV